MTTTQSQPQSQTATRWVHCRVCGDEIDPPERGLIKDTCKPCGEVESVTARSGWCIATMHKSNSVLITDPALLVGINLKQI
jgi:hypothetical protein